MEIVNDTMLFMRWSPFNDIHKINNKTSSYGYSMPPALTTHVPGFEESTSHHRVMRYTLGGMECLVRFEVDGYVEEPELHDSSDSEEASNGWQDLFLAQDDAEPADTSLAEELPTAVLSSMERLKLEPLDKSHPSKFSKGVQVIERGALVPPHLVFGMKSRTAKKTLSQSKIAASYWFMQVGRALIGYHETRLRT